MFAPVSLATIRLEPSVTLAPILVLLARWPLFATPALIQSLVILPARLAPVSLVSSILESLHALSVQLSARLVPLPLPALLASLKTIEPWSMASASALLDSTRL